MFSLTYKKIKNEYSSETIILNSPELKPNDETYVNMYMNDETTSLFTLDNEGNIIEFIGSEEE
jgi:hypothetical protein